MFKKIINYVQCLKFWNKDTKQFEDVKEQPKTTIKTSHTEFIKHTPASTTSSVQAQKMQNTVNKNIVKKKTKKSK